MDTQQFTESYKLESPIVNLRLKYYLGDGKYRVRFVRFDNNLSGLVSFKRGNKTAVGRLTAMEIYGFEVLVLGYVYGYNHELDGYCSDEKVPSNLEGIILSPYRGRIEKFLMGRTIKNDYKIKKVEFYEVK